MLSYWSPLRLQLASCQFSPIKMQSAFSSLDSAVASVNSQMEDGSLDPVRVKAIFYAKPYTTDPRHLIRIGMNFSSETRTIAQWKVQ